MITIRQRLEGVRGANANDVELILKHLKKAGFESDDDSEGVFEDLDVTELEQPLDCGPLLYKHKLIINKVTGNSEPLRKVSRTGFRSRPSANMPVDEVTARKLWDRHVASKPVKAECCEWDPDSPEVETWLPHADDILVAARWLHLRLFEGQHQSDLQGLSDAPQYEPLWHKGLVRFFQAAAGGQPNLKYERELHDPDDAAREDIRGLVERAFFGQLALAPGECKKEVTPSSSEAIFTGGQQEGLAKLFKVCWSKYCDYGRTFICVFTVFFKAVWVVRFRFLGTPDVALPTPSADSDDTVLAGCDVVPHFPASPELDGTESCILCPDTLSLLERTEPIRNLSELLVESGSRRGSLHPTPGFTLLVRSVLGQCKLWGLKPVEKLTLVLDTNEEWELSALECRVVAAGARSLVLQRRATDNFVVKIGAKESISKEARIHDQVDGKGCEYLRALEKDEHGRGMRGTVRGAGSDLAFICLADFCVGSLEPRHVANLESLQKYFTQAQQALTTLHNCEVLHRDLKSDNMLISSSGNLLLNDFDVSAFKEDKLELKDRVGNDCCRSPIFEQNYESNGAGYTTRDDLLGLAVAFLELRGHSADTVFKKRKLLEKFKQARPAQDAGIPIEMRQCIAQAIL